MAVLTSNNAIAKISQIFLIHSGQEIWTLDHEDHHKDLIPSKAKLRLTSADSPEGCVLLRIASFKQSYTQNVFGGIREVAGNLQSSV